MYDDTDVDRIVDELNASNTRMRGPHWFTCTTLAGGKPLKNVLLAAE